MIWPTYLLSFKPQNCVYLVCKSLFMHLAIRCLRGFSFNAFICNTIACHLPFHLIDCLQGKVTNIHYFTYMFKIHVNIHLTCMILIGIRMLTLNCFHVDSKYYDQENAKYQNKVSFIVV